MMNLLASASTYTQFTDLLNLDFDMDMENEKVSDSLLPLDAAAALAAAFGIGFNDMSRDGSSLDPCQNHTQPATENSVQEEAGIGGFEQRESDWKAGGYGNTKPPLDAAAALAASFGIGLDFGGSTGDGQGVSTPMTISQLEDIIRPQPPRLSFSSSSESRERPMPSKTEDVTAVPPVDAAAALAASFGIGFDDATERERRMVNDKSDMRRASTVAGTEVRKEPAKMTEGKPKKRFKKRTGTTRERTGCLTCRQRRKKCDENTYPICGHCRRLNLECVREAPRPLHIPSASVSHPSTAPLLHPTQPPQPASCSGATPPFQSSSLTSRRYSTGSASIGGYGDLARVSMDGMDFRVQIPEGLAMPMCDDGNGSSTDRRYLMKYYTQVLASLVTTNHENNSFLSVFLPMAIDSPPLLSALTAWSCAHLSRFHAPYHTPLLHRRGQALRLVAESLASPSPSLPLQETLLAASLVLCSLEIIHGDTEGHWLRHLKGASLIIENAKSGNGWETEKFGPDALRGSSDGQWLLRNFAYHDVLGSVTLGKPPMIRGVYWLEQKGRGGMVDTYMGVGSKILAFISEISCLEIPSSLTTQVDGTDMDGDERSFDERADELERGLQEWTPPMVIQQGLVPLAEAWRSAALLCLYRKRRAYLQHLLSITTTATFPSPTDNTQSSLKQLAGVIAEQATSVLTHISEIPPSSLPESGVLFPIFLAGGETKKVEEMEAIRLRLREMEGFRGFTNIGRALEVLEELWRCWGTGVKGGGGLAATPNGAGTGRGVERDVMWEDVCWRRGWLLVLA